ncbi:MAG: lipopolysaccharide biosynthesis protein [Acidobacteria bacterium]|nr:lipopolysaccharide biosynthesis protein [Acidobacteriota bacterium]
MDTAKSYLPNYLRTYLWQCLSIVTGFLSMFVVVPRLSSNHAMFGIYSICVSVTILASYADLGFLSAGYRYASQSYATHDMKREVQVVGFVAFVLSAFVALYALFVAFLATNPTLLIANLSSSDEASAASAMLWTLAAFSPGIVLQRVLQIIYGVRIEAYVDQRISTIGNLAKIASVYLFVSPTGYNIVGYFFSCQVITLLCSLTSLGVARVRYHYDFHLFVRSFRFSPEIFKDTRRLALNSLFATFAWVLYYELDAVVIGKTLGPDRLALYAVAFSLATFFRSLTSIIYAPFMARINHLVALRSEDRLRALYRRVMVVTEPASLFPVISLVLLMRPFVFSWVGGNYAESVVIAQMLILIFAGAFSSNPASYLLVAQERIRELYIVNAVSPIIFWAGILMTWHVLDIAAFGLFKLVGAVPVLIWSLGISIRCVSRGGKEFVREVLGPAIVPCLFLIIILWNVEGFMPMAKSQINVAIVVGTGAAASSLALLLYYWGSREFREAVADILKVSFSRPKVEAAAV